MRPTLATILLLSLGGPALAQTAPGDPPLSRNAGDDLQAPSPVAGPFPPPLPIEDGWPPPRRDRRWFFSMQAGPTYQRLYDTSIYGGTIGAAADLELDVVEFTLGCRFGYGDLSTGLGALQFDVESTLGAHLGVLRFGAGFGVGLMSIASVTSDSNATAGALVLSLFLSADVAPLGDDGGAWFVGLRFTGTDVLVSDASPFAWGPAAVVGFRL